MSHHFTQYFLLLALLSVLSNSFGEFVRRSAPLGRQKSSSLCGMCENRTSHFLKENCPASLNYHMQGRCCMDSVNTTVGLDLGNCSLHYMYITHELLSSVKEITWLNIDDNPNFNCSYSKFDEAFKGLRKLTMISMPKYCSCPGSRLLWNTSVLTKDNATLCKDRLDTCQVMNVKRCPSNSYCVDNGPGFYECQCKPPWGGYKCMSKTGIPLAIILGTIAGATVLILLVLWIPICRRKKRHSQGYTWT